MNRVSFAVLMVCIGVLVPDLMNGSECAAQDQVQGPRELTQEQKELLARADAAYQSAVMKLEESDLEGSLTDLQVTIELRKRVWGTDHEDVARGLDDLALILLILEQPAEALQVRKEALKIYQRLHGDADHPDVAAGLFNLACEMEGLGRPEEALPLFEQSLAMYQRLHGDADHPYVAAGLNNLALVLASLSRPEEALPLFEQSLAMYQRLNGDADHPYTAAGLNNVASTLGTLGRSAEALPLHEQSLLMYSRLHGDEDHLDVVRGLSNVALTLGRLDRPAEALPLLEQSLSMSRRLYGEADHPVVARVLSYMAVTLGRLDRPAEALPLIEQSLSMSRRLYGNGDHLAVASGLNDLAAALDQLERPAEALPLYEQSLAMYRRLNGGEDHPDLARGLRIVAGTLLILGRPLDALPLLEQSLSMSRRLHGDEDNPDVAMGLSDLASALSQLGRPAEALPLHEQSLSMSRRLYGDVDHLVVASVLNELAATLDQLGRPAEAMLRQETALSMCLRLYDGRDHPNVVKMLCNLAVTLVHLGRPSDALPLFEKSLSMSRRLYGDADHPDVARGLGNLSSVLARLGNQTEALPLQEQALTMYQRLYGDVDHPDVAKAMNNLAADLGNLRRSAEALTLYEQSLLMYRSLHGDEDHLDVATTLNNMGILFAEMGRSLEAATFFSECARIEWGYLRTNFPLLTPLMQRELMSTGLQSVGPLFTLVFVADMEAEAAVAAEPVDASVGLRGVLLSKGLLSEVSRTEGGAVHEVVASAPESWRVRWDEYVALRRQYATFSMQDRFSDRLARLDEASAPVDPAFMRDLSSRIEDLDRELRNTNPAYALEARLRDVTLEDAVSGLRTVDALLEMVRYRPYDFSSREYGSLRYGAYVLRADGSVVAVDLGDAEPIDGLIADYRRLMEEHTRYFVGVTRSAGQMRRSENELNAISSQLRGLVWSPLEDTLGGVERVYLAPDGDLSLLPFEALAQKAEAGHDPAHAWRYLGEDVELVYLTSGRDLGRAALLAAQPKAGTAGRDAPKTALLIGRPKYDATPGALAPVVAGLAAPERSDALGQTDADEIDTLLEELGVAPTTVLGGGGPAGTIDRTRLPVKPWRDEPVLEELVNDASDQLEELGWSTRVLTRDLAVEEAVLEAESPTLLQIATHGYLLAADPDATSWDNPLLRSVLVFAGADTWRADQSVYYRHNGAVLSPARATELGVDESELTEGRFQLADGILTGYEVATMNLRGTELVNLTACETGLGEVTPDGVVGLRQAFILAGAKSLTVSMWSVPTQETRDQIAGFYNHWQGAAGMGRYAAFRRSQTDALESARATRGSGHPFCWAGVIYVGDPGDLKGR